MSFNNTPLEKDAIKKGDYRVWYHRERVAIDRIVVKKNTVFLYPKGQCREFFTQELIAPC